MIMLLIVEVLNLGFQSIVIESSSSMTSCEFWFLLFFSSALLSLFLAYMPRSRPRPHPWAPPRPWASWSSFESSWLSFKERLFWKTFSTDSCFLLNIFLWALKNSESSSIFIFSKSLDSSMMHTISQTSKKVIEISSSQYKHLQFSRHFIKVDSPWSRLECSLNLIHFPSS